MLTITEKKCPTCKRKKPAKDFSKCKRSLDGLAWCCKSCQKDYRLILKLKEKKSPVEKRCTACGEVKPRSDFYVNIYNSDGLRDWCIHCEKKYQSAMNKKRNERAAEQSKSPAAPVGISTWDQVNGVLREIAELQLEAKAEVAKCKERVVLIIKDSEGVVSPVISRQIFLRSLLESFLRKTCPSHKQTLKKFRFGSLRFCRKRLHLELNLEHAAARLGLP